MSIFFALLISLGFLLLFLFSLFIFQLHYCTKPKYLSSSSTNEPPSYPIIGCLITFYQNRHRLLHWYTQLLSNSPTQTITVRRLGSRRTIITANPTNVEHILKTNFNNYPKGKPFTEILGDFLGRGIFNVDGELWSAQRKFVSHEFSTRSLKEFTVQTIEEVQHRLIPLLESASNCNQVIDLQDVLKRFTFDAVCKVSLGTNPCSLDLSQPLPPLVEAFDRAAQISAMRAATPVFLWWKIKRALNLGSEKSLKEAVRVVHDSVMEIIRNKKGNFKSNHRVETDFLTRLLEAGYDDQMVRDMLISFIMAGRDTTSSAMTWLFWLLSQHPSKEEMIMSEVKAVFGSENGDELRAFDYEGLKKLSFLKACLYESMRLYPPVVWDSKHAVAGDVLPDGTVVGRGDRVTYFPYGMGRMEELWGKDCHEFKPDRWFDEPWKDDGVLKNVSPYKFAVFQAGPRVCLGKEMAFIQMNYVVATILSRFKIRPVCTEQPVFVPLLTAHMAGGYKVRVQKKTDSDSPTHGRSME